MQLGRAEHVPENTHHPGAGTSPEPHEQLGLAALLALVLHELVGWPSPLNIMEMPLSLKPDQEFQVPY